MYTIVKKYLNIKFRVMNSEDDWLIDKSIDWLIDFNSVLINL